jgi:hypothetical protein
MPVILATPRLRQGGSQFQASLGEKSTRPPSQQSWGQGTLGMVALVCHPTYSQKHK